MLIQDRRFVPTCLGNLSLLEPNVAAPRNGFFWDMVLIMKFGWTFPEQLELDYFVRGFAPDI